MPGRLLCDLLLPHWHPVLSRHAPATMPKLRRRVWINDSHARQLSIRLRFTSTRCLMLTGAHKLLCFYLTIQSKCHVMDLILAKNQNK